ncbi:MAG: DNA-binding response regulator [Lysobacterales bacterium CG02_land_8_20_14_3_00_62_12]|nr:MAG: DNA-binding response regulator [Xanthomonadales bacterium CG02_land_8_20_14_3_00_62_12]
MRVLLVEDDVLLGEGICAALRRAGLTVDWLRDGESARIALIDGSFDLVVLDLGLPRLHGSAVIEAVRGGGSQVPILVLTARDRVSERVQALNLGADDFMGKPFDTSELLARIRALHRRSIGRVETRIEHGDLELDQARLAVVWRGHQIELPRREFHLLWVLVENAGRIVSRETLQQKLYGWDEDIESNAIDVHIHHLRRKLSPELIRNVRGVGYVLELLSDGLAP